jgi:hypothetical protein
MDDISIQISHRMIYLFNITLGEEPIFLNTIDYPFRSEDIIICVDYCINNMDIQNLPKDLQETWMTDKFTYVTWLRDSLLKLHSK